MTRVEGQALMVAKRHSGSRFVRTLLCTSLIGTLTPIAGAQIPGPDVSALVADLGSPEISKREEAMRILTADPTLTLPQLEALLKNPDLSPEQRSRISQAAKQRFMNSPRPAMGVSFDQSLPDRVAILQVYEKFPSVKLLEAGDIIVSCMGEKLHSRSAWIRLGAHIFSREPGETITIVVRRGAEKLTIDVPLGHYSDLSTRVGPGEERLERAWELRSRAYITESRPVIDPQIPATEWKPDPSPLEVQKLVRYKSQLTPAYRPRLVAGGEPRGGLLDYEELKMLIQNPANPGVNRFINRGWEQQLLAQQGIGPGWSNIGGLLKTTEQELISLEKSKVALERQLDALTAPGVHKPDQLVQLERMMQPQREELARIKRQIEAIRAEAAEEEANGADPEASAAPVEP